MRFKVKNGTIQGIEAAASSCCATKKSVVEDYESHKPGRKSKKGQ